MGNIPENKDSSETDGYRNWSHKLEALQQIGKSILKEWRAENPQSTRDYPTASWLTNNGYSHLRWVLRVKHDMGLPEFFIMITAAGGSEEYDWNIDDLATIERAKTYLNDRVECRDWDSSTKRTQRARLNEVLGRFSNEFGDDKILAIANNPDIKTEVYESFKEVIKSLREDLTSDDSAHHYTRATHRFFESLDRSSRIAYDPMSNIENEFSWNWDTESNPLTENQVQQLWIVAETDEERMVVIGYCVWGLRTKELAGVHIDQIHLDHDEPYIEFEEPDRKNGQGQVSLMFGLDTLASLVETRKEDPNWNGCLFPSNDLDRSFLCSDQMRRRFKDLSRRADVTVDGDLGTPKHGRAFYYNILAKAETELLEIAGKIAEEQGASDAATVRDAYLTPEQRRRLRRAFFRHEIRDILPDDAYTEYSTRTDFDTSLDDFK